MDFLNKKQKKVGNFTLLHNETFLVDLYQLKEAKEEWTFFANPLPTPSKMWNFTEKLIEKFPYQPTYQAHKL